MRYVLVFNRVLNKLQLPKGVADRFWNELHWNELQMDKMKIPPTRRLSEDVEKENGDMEWER